MFLTLAGKTSSQNIQVIKLFECHIRLLEADLSVWGGALEPGEPAERVGRLAQWSQGGGPERVWRGARERGQG